MSGLTTRGAWTWQRQTRHQSGHQVRANGRVWRAPRQDLTPTAFAWWMQPWFSSRTDHAPNRRTQCTCGTHPDLRTGNAVPSRHTYRIRCPLIWFFQEPFPNPSTSRNCARSWAHRTGNAVLNRCNQDTAPSMNSFISTFRTPAHGPQTSGPFSRRHRQRNAIAQPLPQSCGPATSATA